MKQLCILVCMLYMTSYSLVFAQNRVTLVIDAGHGGSDHGHVSNNPNHLPEKDLNLIISKLVGSYINQYLKNVDVIYTRKDDTFISLDDRVAKANGNNATYFISIHCNDGNGKDHIHGTETHIHDFSSKKSVALAKELDHQFSHRAGRHSRGIKDTDDREHSLQVLKYTTMTSVLVECGFLTNEKEANYLNTTLGQEVIASAIFRGFRSFIQAEFPKTNFLKDGVNPGKDKNKVVASTVKQEGNYTIQLMSSKEPIETTNTEFKGLGMEVIRVNLNTTNAYKYLYKAGTFTTKEEANMVLEKVKKKGFKDAIVISK